MAIKKEKSKKREVKEVFEIEEKGKKKIIEKRGIEEVPIEKKGEKSYESKILRNVLISFLLVALLVVGVYYYLDSIRNPDYFGVEFKTVQEGNLIFYQTYIPVIYKGNEIPYNFYIRTNPNDLEKIPFEDNENFELMKFAVINFSEQFDCDKDEIIAIANLKKLHDVVGINFIKDDSATCDDEGRYNYFNLMVGDKTEIEKIGNHCYNVKIANCEVLPATEKIMAEMFLKLS